MFKYRFLALGFAVAVILCVLATAMVIVSPSLRSRLQESIPAPWLAKVNEWRFGYGVDNDIVVTMPDGVKLAASLYRPNGAQGRLPTVLMRLPYHRLRNSEALGGSSFFARNGYAVLVVDLRGTGDSQGEFIPYRHGTSDGSALLDWIVAQPWSNGRIGTYGCSALGEIQFSLARANHPAHTAMIALGAGGGLGLLNGRASYGGYFEGGVFNLASGFGWFVRNGSKDPKAPQPDSLDITATLRNLPTDSLVQRARPVPNGYDDYIRTPLTDPAWRALDYFMDGDPLAKPALIVNSWGDQTLGDTLAMSEWVRTTAAPEIARAQHVVIAPGDHCDHTGPPLTDQWGELEVRNSDQPYKAWFLRWFDHWLRGQGPGLDDLPPYLYYMLGEHRWLTAKAWPPEDTQPQRWVLGNGNGNAGGKANSASGTGTLRLQSTEPAPAATDEFRYDPMNPVPTRGGPICCTANPADKAGPQNQHDVESRADVLVYTSEPMATPLRIAGPLHARLTIASSARDTDFVARLSHVWPDGRSVNIQEGALRVRYRDGVGQTRWLEPGVPVPITIDMRSIAYTIPVGHRLRFVVTSSSFPRLERNLNTGGNIHDEARAEVAINQVRLGGAQPSYVELPVLPAN